MKTKLGLAIGLVLGLGAGVSVAADDGFYLGVGTGLAISSPDTATATAITQYFGGTVTGTSTDDNDTAVRFFAGYNFNKYIGVEVGYSDLGESSVTVLDAVNGLTDYYKFAVTGYGISVVGNLPINNKFSAFGKLGVFSWNSDINAEVDLGFPFGVISADISESGTVPVIGIGAIYRFTKNFSIRGEIEHIAIDKADAGTGDFNVVTANAMFHF